VDIPEAVGLLSNLGAEDRIRSLGAETP